MLIVTLLYKHIWKYEEIITTESIGILTLIRIAIRGHISTCRKLFSVGFDLSWENIGEAIPAPQAMKGVSVSWALPAPWDP